MSYNGWTNRETWLVSIWFNPETEEDVDAAQEAIEGEYEEMTDFMRDFVDIDVIDWDELRASVADEEEEEEEED